MSTKRYRSARRLKGLDDQRERDPVHKVMAEVRWDGEKGAPNVPTAEFLRKMPW